METAGASLPVTYSSSMGSKWLGEQDEHLPLKLAVSTSNP